MNFGQLMYLIDISKTNSINTTAKRMFASQQAVSESIKRLETELNCTLLNRSKTGTELTEDGNYVLTYATNMVEQYHELLHHFQDSDPATHPVGNLTIALAPLTATMLLTDILLKTHSYQDINLYVKEYPMELILDLISSNDIDFGLFGFAEHKYLDIVKKCNQSTNAKLHIEELYVDKLVCVMSQHNALASKKSITTSQAFKHKHTMYNYSTKQKQRETCLHMSNNTKIHQKFMKEEDSVCLMPSHAYKMLYQKKDFHCIPVSDSDPIRNCLIYKDSDETKTDLLYKTFINLTTSVVNENF